MAEFLTLTNPKLDLSDYTLFIPSVSVGNVPQLTIDLLISSEGLHKVGTIWHSAVIPIVSKDPYNAGDEDICTACELYASENRKIAAIQLRSGLVGPRADSFFNDLRQTLEPLKLREIFIIASAFAQEMHDVQSNPFRYFTENAPVDVFEDTLTTIKQELYSINGCGFAMKLHEVVSTAVPSTVLLRYSSEGDNRPDAIQMLQLLRSAVLALKATPAVSTIQEPLSWKYVFGTAPPFEMY